VLGPILYNLHDYVNPMREVREALAGRHSEVF